MNFISKDKLLAIFGIPEMSGDIGVLLLNNDGVNSMWNPYQNFGYDNWTDTSKKNLQYLHSKNGYYEDLEMNIQDGPTGNAALVQSFLSFYPQWSSVTSMHQCISISPIGDGIVANSLEVISGSDTYKDYTFNQTQYALPGFADDDLGIGVIFKNSMNPPIYGYVWYNRGIILTYDSLQQTISNWNNVSATSCILKYSTYLDKKEDKYLCNLNRRYGWSTSNPSYWTPIDQTNTTITSALTAYWAQYELTSLTIDNDAKNWLIIEEKDYPLYVTGIGLYNDNNELLAIAKLRNPQTVPDKTSMGFIVQLNY